MADRQQDEPQALDLEHFSHQQMVALATRGFARYEARTAAIQRARDTFWGRNRIVPKGGLGIAEDVARQLGPLLPQRKTLILNLVNTLAEVVPDYKRFTLGGSAEGTDEERAEAIEAFDRAAFEQKVDWYSCVWKLAFEGEVGLAILPSPADPFAPDEFQEVLDEAGYKGLKPADRAGYARRKKTGDYARTRPRFLRDREGRDRQHPSYGGRDTQKSKAAYRRYLTDYKASRFPISVRLVSATDCAPFQTRGNDRDRWACRGMVIRTLLDEETLIRDRGLAWEGMPLGTNFFAPRASSSDTYGNDNGVYLYEALMELVDPKTKERHPVVATCVGGRETWYADDDREPGDREGVAILDLCKEFGVDTLWANYFYGLRTAEDEPDLTGLPFGEPYAPLIVSIEGLLADLQVAAHKYVTGKFAIQPDPNAPAASYMESDGSGLKAFDWDDENADFITLPPGTVAPINPPPLSDPVRFTLPILMGMFEGATPSIAKDVGAGAASSGHQLALTKTFGESAYGSIRESLRRMHEFVGEAVNHTIACMQEKFETSFPIYANVESDPTGSGTREVHRQVIEIENDWFGGNYRVTSLYPPVGNLAEKQQAVNNFKDGVISYERMAGVLGITNPRRELVKIANDQYFMTDPAGRLELQERAAIRRKDMARAQRLKMLREKLMAGDSPSAAVSPEAGALAQQAMGGGSNGMAVPNLAQNALNGANAGAVGSAALQHDATAIATAGPPAPNGVV